MQILLEDECSSGRIVVRSDLLVWDKDSVSQCCEYRCPSTQCDTRCFCLSLRAVFSHAELGAIQGVEGGWWECCVRDVWGCPGPACCGLTCGAAVVQMPPPLNTPTPEYPHP